MKKKLLCYLGTAILLLGNVVHGFSRQAADVTDSIVNPRFDNNDGNGWTGTGTVNYHEVEFYQSTFNMRQPIIGLRAGKYTLKAQGYERPSFNDGGAAYKAGTETISARLYAGTLVFPEKNTAFNSLYKHAYTGDGSLNGYADNMESAEVMLTSPDSNYYELTLPGILLDSNDVLTIGAKSAFQQDGTWVLFDNFRLVYEGTNYDTSDYVTIITARVARAQYLLITRIPDSVSQALNAAIAQGQAAVNASPLVQADMVAATDALNAAIAMANAVYTLFEADSLQAVINEADSLYRPDAKGADSLQAAIATATGFLNSQSKDDIYKAITDLEKAIYNYNILNASPASPYEVTNAIVNPGFNNNDGAGWMGTGAVNYHEVEFYQRTFDMRQYVSGLPAGKYVLKAQGYERPSFNDGGTAYKAGTETISARLYAANYFSEKSTPFNSLYKHAYTGAGSLNGYADNMASAEVMLTNPDSNYYELTLPGILLDSNAVLTIGAKSAFQQGGTWVLFDNFRLVYQGSLDTSDYVAFINDQIIKAQALQAERIQDSSVQALNAAIGQGQAAVNASPLVLASLISAKNTLGAAITAATASLATYDTLQIAIDYANQVLGWYSDDEAKKAIMEPAIATANTAVNDASLSTPDIRQATADLKAATQSVDKKVYTAWWRMGDVTNPDNAWSNTRSVQSKDWILFWEKGFNTTSPDSLRLNGFTCDVNWMLNLAEQSFNLYADSLKFITKGRSKSDTYKMVILLRYSPDWEATGSGVDDLIGLLTLTPWAYVSRGGQTAAHEIGHCFQYQVHCDNNDQNGWMYGYGPGGAGWNTWWEQCAQWQAYKVFPFWKFDNEWFPGYLSTVNKNALHEAPRYENFFIQDYWCSLHGTGIIGRLWNESYFPEDPIETYKRITNTGQTQFNDEMYDCAAKFASWDIDAIRSYGAPAIGARPQPQMNDAGNNYWRIDPWVCPENYGHNIIQLNAPSAAATVTASFQGLAGIDGYRKNYLSEAGWRYGFVALLKDGTRVYGDMRPVDMTLNNGADSVSFQCPDNCDRLWLVVSGAPKSHWRHVWDDDDSNDEQWPYQVRFGNTNLIGQPNVPPTVLPIALSSFTATPVEQQVRLNWYTMANVNRAGFDVERSADGKAFGKIGRVAAASGSLPASGYAFTDVQPLAGKNYYRLRQEDKDGSFSYSNVLSVTMKAFRPVSVYPTVTTGAVQVNPNGEKGTLILRNAQGATVQTAACNGTGILHLHMDALPAGMYFWQLNAQKGKIVKE